MIVDLMAALQSNCNESGSSSWFDGKVYQLGKQDLIVVADLDGESDGECEFHLKHVMVGTIMDWVEETVGDATIDFIPVYIKGSTGAVIVRTH